jgi:hypothetical protein
MFQTRFVEKKYRLHFMLSNFCANHAFYDIMQKKLAESGRPQITTWCMHIAWWITEATNKHL